jgi:hypothetical protein
VTAALARRANLPAYLLLYAPAAIPNPADPSQPDIASFRVKRLHPEPEHAFRTVNPEEWAKALLDIRKFGAEQVDQQPGCA